MPIPANAQTIYEYLTGHGLNDNAAAGVLGNIEQESGGDPTAGSKSAGYGLIQWTGQANEASIPPTVSGQLPLIIDYIDANGGINLLNANSSTPSQAALFFSNQYERPAAWAANNQNREASAQQVAAAAQSGNWKSSSSSDSTSASLTSDPVGTLASKVNTGIANLPDDLLIVAEVCVGVLGFSLACIALAVVLSGKRAGGTVGAALGAAETAGVLPKGARALTTSGGRRRAVRSRSRDRDWKAGYKAHEREHEQEETERRKEERTRDRRKTAVPDMRSGLKEGEEPF